VSGNILLRKDKQEPLRKAFGDLDGESSFVVHSV
jgi:hypothetical protein